MRFTTKILLMPLLAFLALSVVFFSLWRAGSQARDLFDLIETQQVRALELAHEMEITSNQLRQTMADAVTVGDPDLLLEADSLATVFRTTWLQFSSMDNSTTFDSTTAVQTDTENRTLYDSFQSYFAHARITSQRMIDEDLSEELIADAFEMNQMFEELMRSLTVTTEHRQAAIASAFDEARDKIRALGKAISLTILLLFIILLLSSIGAIISVLRPLRRLTNATEAITRGNLNATIDYDCNDEMGRLATSFRHMQASLIADIERREEMESALRESERKYRLLADNISDTIWTMNREGEFTYFSPSVERHLGYTQDEAVKLRVSELFGPEECDEMTDRVEAMLNDPNSMRGDAVRSEARLLRKDGTRIWMEITSNLLFDETGEVVGLTGISRDITDRKLAEEALRQSEERLRSIFMNATMGIFRSTPDGNVLAANPAAAQITGYDSPEAAVEAVTDMASQVYADPEDRVWVLQALELNGEVAGELDLKRADGTLFTASINLWVVKDEDGEIRFIEGLIDDITERRAMQEALRHSEERLQLAFSAANDGLFDNNIQTGEFYWSPRFFEMLGYAPGEIEPSFDTLRSLIHPEDYDKGPVSFEKHITEGTPYELEARFQKRDDTWIWVHVRAKVVEFDEEGHPVRFVGTIVDITKRKVAELELKKAQQELINAAHTAGMAEIATSVLHNVGNALNGALTSTTMMDKTLKSSRVTHLARLADVVKEHEGDFAGFVANTDQGKKLPAFFRQIADVLRGEHARLDDELASLVKSHEHIRQIIALQQQYAGTPGYTEEVNAEDLVHDAVQLFGASFARHHIQFRVEKPDELPSVTVEKHKVLQILINLLKNARDAVREADRPDREITVTIEQNGEELRYLVRDNGIGIREDHLEKVFGYGFTTKRDGHGYGLHGCANSAKEMGGELTVTSEGEGQGATFTVRLPLTNPEEARVSTADAG